MSPTAATQLQKAKDTTLQPETNPRPRRPRAPQTPGTGPAAVLCTAAQAIPSEMSDRQKFHLSPPYELQQNKMPPMKKVTGPAAGLCTAAQAIPGALFIDWKISLNPTYALQQNPTPPIQKNLPLATSSPSSSRTQQGGVPVTAARTVGSRAGVGGIWTDILLNVPSEDWR